MIKCQVMSTELFKIVICHQVKDFDKFFKQAKCASITIVSSNTNEVIKAILNSFIKNFPTTKKHKTLTNE